MKLPDKLSLEIIEEAVLINNQDKCYEDDYDVISYMEDLPYYTAGQLIDMGTYDNRRYFGVEPDNYMITSELSCKKWFEQYKLVSSGIVTKEYDKLNKLRIEKLHELYSNFNTIKESNNLDLINARKQSILNLGWNPELNFENIDIRLRVTEFKRIELKEQLINYSLIDISNDDFPINSLNESKTDDSLKPLYIILTYTGTMFGKVISKVTDCTYSHSGLSFSPKLNNIYTFNAKTNGLSFESLKDYLEYTKEGIMCVYTIFINNKLFNKVEEAVNKFISEKDKNKYSFLIGLGAVMNKPIHLNNAMICSQFVDTILKIANMDLFNKDSFTVLPSDFYKSTNKQLIKLYEGPMIKYNQSIIKRKVDSMKNKLVKENVLNEVKEFPIGFDNEGNLLIKNMKRLDFNIEYSKSHKLLKMYESTNNYNGMSYELSKLWFLNSVLENKIYNKTNSDELRKELLKNRSRILNDYTKYIKIVSTNVPHFNFTEYYNNTPFSDATFKISNSTLKYGFKLLKALL